MSQSTKVITFINIAHFIDHYAMLIFAAAVIVIAPNFNMGYGELLPYATPGFIAFGAGSLLTGWLGDKWSRYKMMAIFFFGMGFALIGIALIRTPLQLGIMLFIIGLIAAIYHPVGTAMLAANAKKLGKEMGVNGVFGNVGVATSALITGVINQYFNWRISFVIPGMVSLGIGFLYLIYVPSSIDQRLKKSSSNSVQIKKSVMVMIMASIVITVIASSTTFNTITVGLPKLIQERLASITVNTATLGVITFFIYLSGAISQIIIGNLLDKYSLKTIFLPLAIVIVPTLYLAAFATDYWLALCAVVIVVTIFGQVTVNDTMLGKYTADEWRSRAYAARYFLGFTAAGLSVGLVSILYNQGGFQLLLIVVAMLSLLTVVGAILFPKESQFGKN